MAMIVRVQWKDGKPCSGVRICAWVNGEGNKNVLTDSNGEAHFGYGPGRGSIYCEGTEIIKERHLSAKEIITCERSGMFSFRYF